MLLILIVLIIYIDMFIILKMHIDKLYYVINMNSFYDIDLFFLILKLFIFVVAKKMNLMKFTKKVKLNIKIKYKYNYSSYQTRDNIIVFRLDSYIMEINSNNKNTLSTKIDHF